MQEQTNEPGTEVPKKVEERKEPDSNKPHSSDDKDAGDKQATTTDAGNKQPAAKLQQVKTEPAEEATRRKENPEEEEEERLQKEAHASYMRYFRSIRPLVCVSSPFELEAITLILIPVLMWFLRVFVNHRSKARRPAPRKCARSSSMPEGSLEPWIIVYGMGFRFLASRFRSCLQCPGV